MCSLEAMSVLKKIESIVGFGGISSRALFLIYLFCIYCERIKSFFCPNDEWDVSYFPGPLLPLGVSFGTRVSLFSYPK